MSNTYNCIYIYAIKILKVETALFNNYAFLGTTINLNCPHSPSNENLFSCDNEI